jgi:O-antigen/teichoic acid export membrane protein
MTTMQPDRRTQPASAGRSRGAVDVGEVLVRNTAWNYGGFVINLGTNLIMFPYVVHHLGDAASGVWLLLAAVTGYMGLLELGIVPSLTQIIAAALARGERDGVSRAASSSQAVLVALAVVSLLLLGCSAGLVRMLRVPPSLETQALLALRVAIVGFALRMPLATYQGILLGSQRQDRCNQLWIIVGLVKFIAAAIVLTLGYGLVALVTTEMIIHLLAGAPQIRWVFKEVPTLRLSWRLVNYEDVRHLLSFGTAMLAVTVCSLVIEQADRLVVASFLPIAMVTHYAAAWKIYMLAFAITTTVVQAVSPLAAELHGRADRPALTRLFLRTTKYSVILAWPLVLSLAFAGGFVLRIWMGESFVGSLQVVQVLAASFAITAYNHAGYSALIGMRRVGPTLWRYFVPQAILNLALSVLLVQRLGIVGVALGTMVPAAALEYFFLGFVLAELQVTWKEFFARTVTPVALPALVAFSPLALMYVGVDSRSFLLPLVAVACSLVYALLVWRGLDKEERDSVLEFLPGSLRTRARMTRSAQNLAARPSEGL